MARRRTSHHAAHRVHKPAHHKAAHKTHKVHKAAHHHAAVHHVSHAKVHGLKAAAKRKAARAKGIDLGAVENTLRSTGEEIWRG